MLDQRLDRAEGLGEREEPCRRHKLDRGFFAGSDGERHHAAVVLHLTTGDVDALATLGHVAYRVLRDAYEQQVAGMLVGGVDAVLVETAQDLLQAKAAIVGARRAVAASGIDECT